MNMSICVWSEYMVEKACFLEYQTSLQEDMLVLLVVLLLYVNVL